MTARPIRPRSALSTLLALANPQHAADGCRARGELPGSTANLIAQVGETSTAVQARQ